MFFKKNESEKVPNIGKEMDECLESLKDKIIDESFLQGLENCKKTEEKLDFIMNYLENITYEYNYFIQNFPVALFAVDL